MFVYWQRKRMREEKGMGYPVWSKREGAANEQMFGEKNGRVFVRK